MTLTAYQIVSAFLGQTATDPFTGKPAPIEVREIGRLRLPTGRIVACDPFVAADSGPFSRAVPPGDYPVRLAIADLQGDQRVAYAGVFFSDAVAASWEMAVLPHLKGRTSDHEYWYGVDSGTGSFGDVKAMSRLDAAIASQPDCWEQVNARMEETYVHTWSWTEETRFGEDGNIFLFSSGLGDGAYPSFFGLDASGDPSCLVTDFCVLGEDEEGLGELTHKRWWEFWKR